MGETNPGLDAIVALLLYGFPIVALVGGIVWHYRERRRFRRKAAQPWACTFCGGNGWKHARHRDGRPVTRGSVEHGSYVFEDCTFCGGTGVDPHYHPPTRTLGRE